MDVPEVDESFAEEFLCSIFIMYENKFWPDPPCAICLFVYIYELVDGLCAPVFIQENNRYSYSIIPRRIFKRITWEEKDDLCLVEYFGIIKVGWRRIYCVNVYFSILKSPSTAIIIRS